MTLKLEMAYRAAVNPGVKPRVELSVLGFEDETSTDEDEPVAGGPDTFCRFLSRAAAS